MKRKQQSNEPENVHLKKKIAKSTQAKIKSTVTQDAQEVVKNQKIASILTNLNNAWFAGNHETYQMLVHEYNYYDANQNVEFIELKKANTKNPEISTFKSLQHVIDYEAKLLTPIVPDKTREHIYKSPLVVKGNMITSQLGNRYTTYFNEICTKNYRDHIKTYLEFIKGQEKSNEEEEMFEGITDINGSRWTPKEKQMFFTALERCGRHDVTEISRRIGSKTTLEVLEYLDALEVASRSIEKQPLDDSYSAREMSPLFILQENRFAETVQSVLELETFAKHQSILNSPPECLQRAMEFFDIHNTSALNSLFSGRTDITILSSTLVQCYQLVKYLITDIISSLYTELSNNPDKTVTRSMMNHFIAKRERLWKSFLTGSSDARLNNLDIMSILYAMPRTFSSYQKSSSFLAKRRRLLYKDEYNDEHFEEKIISRDSNPNGEFFKKDIENMKDTDDEEDTEDTEDEMLKPIDTEDELQNYYVYRNEEYGDTSDDDEPQHVINAYSGDLSDEHDGAEKNNRDEENEEDDDKDKELEERMKKLDESYEGFLVRQLNFFDEKTLLSN
ncbi:hypothetical protein G6F62_002436 [Rhizopus arrhizus]|nr:hypothetical protein G6F62_002436 [Rhizopus arrhizus]KAG1380600.1 hypothetical protein G6F61_003907 [Rhizopus arrhizus]KAG1404009.1 hypothetical protein G6F60_004633 [Rhizopus arrhizus]